MSTLIGSNLVPARPKEQARYTIRELLILGLTLPIRFCPINKFGPEAIGLEIVSLERIHESLIQYEREQMRQWQIAHHQARKKSIEDARARYKKEEQERARTGVTSSASQSAEMDGDADRTLTEDIPTTTSGHRIMRRIDSFRHPGRQDSLHFQIPPSIGNGPVNINIGLSLDYTPIPGSGHQSSASSTSTQHPWTTRPGASLSSYLKGDVPTPSDNVPPPSHTTAAPSEPEIPTHTTPPTESTSPVAHLLSRGGDTPNSMAVERATEPSLRSYSPTSSIRAPSEADYTEATPPPPPHINVPSPPASQSSTRTPFHYPPPMESAEVPESVAILDERLHEVAMESSTAKDPDSEDEVVVDTPKTGDKGKASAAEPVNEDLSEHAPQEIETPTVEASGRNTGPPPSAKAFLGKGKIDAKAQDDFIAFMLGKK